MYEDGGDVVTGPGPRITLPSIGPTRNDSLALFNNAVAVNDFYRRNDYSVTQERYGANPNVFTNLKSKADKVNDIARLSTRFSALGRPSLNIGTPNGRIPVEKIQYYEKIDKNKFKQRELTYGFLNTNAPMQLFDRRIVPNIFTQYESPINSPYDIAEVYSYDPVSVKPWDMLAPKEKESRIEKYGVSGSPFATKEDFYASLNPPVPITSSPPNLISDNQEVYYLDPGAAPIDPRTGKLNLKRLYNPSNYAGQRYDKEGNKINAQGVRMGNGGLLAFNEGGKSGDPTDEELAKIIYEKYVIKEYQVFDADMAPAGFIIKIATQILNDSNPYKDLEERVMSERASYEDALDPLEDIKFTIITAFPAYKIEELDSYDIDMLIKLLTRAEHYLSKRTPGFNKISFVSANAPPRKPIIDIDAENRALRDAY